MTFVIAHISDTHLSDAKPHWVGNFDAVAADLRASPPDLVINTGDVSLNGADLIDDLRAAHARHAALPMPWRAIPGNHDVGDNQEIARTQPANAERRARWLDVFGPDWWMQDVPGWRLLGLNSLLLGSDIPAAADQEAFIAEAAASIDTRRLALFVHKPLFHHDAGETEVSGHAINPNPRARLFAALGTLRPTLVSCGHLHEHRVAAHAGITQVWAPGTSFTLSDWFLPTHGGEHLVGYIRTALNPDGSFETNLIQPAGIIAHDLADFPDAYGDIRAMRAAAASAS